MVAILVFIGVKLIFHALHTNEVPFINGGHPVHWAPEIGTWQSLGFILAAMLVATMASLTKMWVDSRSARGKDEHDSRQENTVGETDAGGERSH